MVAESNKSVWLGLRKQRGVVERDAKECKEISGVDGYFHCLNCGGIFIDIDRYRYMKNFQTVQAKHAQLIA